MFWGLFGDGQGSAWLCWVWRCALFFEKAFRFNSHEVYKSGTATRVQQVAAPDRNACSGGIMATPTLTRKSRKKRSIRIAGDLAYVELTHGLEAVIDAADVPIVEGLLWGVHFCNGGSLRYAESSFGVVMHRLLMNAPKGVPVDHIDGDGLNNRRANLRLCTHHQNMRNRKINANNKLGLKGVTAVGSRFRACIQHFGSTLDLGRYDTAQEAAAAYNGAARALFGDFARRGKIEPAASD